MKDNRVPVVVGRWSIPASSWSDFTKAAIAAATWTDDRQLYTYVEGVSACTMGEPQPLATLSEPPVDSFEGRIFADPAEVRWRRLEDGRYEGSVVVEGAAEADDRRPATRLLQRYYLLGLETDRRGEFEEGRFPGKVFKYPVPDDWTFDKKSDWRGRAYIEVAEYTRVPDWSKAQGAGTIEDELDAPLLFEHRFVQVGVGVDPEE